MRHLFTMLICIFYLSVLGQETEKGIGVIFLTETLPTKENPKSDSIIIYKDKSLTSIESIYVYKPSNRFDYEIITKNSFSSKAFFEFDYETLGLPIESIEYNNSLVEVIYAFKGNEPMKGWVNLKDKRIGYYLWQYNLLMQYLYFINDEFKFYKNPNGEALEIKIDKTKNGFDYIMKPIKISDDWMLVKVVTPSDYCDDPSKKTEITCWIKYLSNKGRPLVWYYTRGC